MLRYLLLILSLFLLHSAHSFQSCKDSSSGLESLFRSDYDYDESDGEQQPFVYDSSRTNKFEVKYGVNILVGGSKNAIIPIGLNLSICRAIARDSKLYIGGAFTTLSYGSQSDEVAFGAYDEVNTWSTVNGVSFLAKYSLTNSKEFQAFLGLRTGLLMFKTQSIAVDTTEPCEDRVESKMLNSIMDVRPSFGPFIDLQFPHRVWYNRFTISIGYRMSGETNYVKNGDVKISPYRAEYNEQLKKLNMLSFQIGFSHFF